MNLDRKPHYPGGETSAEGPEAAHKPLRHKPHLLPEDAATELGGGQSVLKSLSWDPWLLLIFSHLCIGGDFCVVFHLYKIHHRTDSLRTVFKKHWLPGLLLSCP